jgi:hypothetical protein
VWATVTFCKEWDDLLSSKLLQGVLSAQEENESSFVIAEKIRSNPTMTSISPIKANVTVAKCSNPPASQLRFGEDPQPQPEVENQESGSVGGTAAKVLVGAGFVAGAIYGGKKLLGRFFNSDRASIRETLSSILKQLKEVDIQGTTTEAYEGIKTKLQDALKTVEAKIKGLKKN